MGSVQIKICGITSPGDAKFCVDAGADMIGLIFAESPRKIDAAAACAILESLPPGSAVQPVGVFMDQPLEEVKRVVEATGLRTVQLHGKEPAEYAEALRALGCRVIKVLTPGEEAGNYPADLFLLDVPKGGARDDAKYRETAARAGGPLLLSGQLDAANVGRWIREFRPAGVDACRATEAAPGKKDPAKVRQFVQAVRNAEKG